MVRSDSWFWPALLLLCGGGAVCGCWHSSEVIRLQHMVEEHWLARAPLPAEALVLQGLLR
jgi:hypothetical protein